MTVRKGCLVHFTLIRLYSVAVIAVECSWEFSLEPQYMKNTTL